MKKRTNILITVDVEYTGRPECEKDGSYKEFSLATMNCKVGNKYYGLPFIIETLNKNNLKGIFFVEPLSQFYFGKKQLANTINLIRKNKHEIQLHIHPAWLKFKDKKYYSDILADYSLGEQIKFIKTGKTILNECGINPIAFRASGFSANNHTYSALTENDIVFSANYNLAYLNKTCYLNLDKVLNDLYKIKDIYEVPITNYSIRDIRNFLRYTYKPMQICCTSFKNMVKTLEYAYYCEMDVVTVVLHNFEFIKRAKKDWIRKPLQISKKVIDSFEKLCAYLNKSSDKYNVITFSDFHDALKKKKGQTNKKFVPPPKINRIYRPL